MAFDGFLFPPETSLFPPASHVLQYLKEFADEYDLIRHIHLSTRIMNAEWVDCRSQWCLTRPDGSKVSFDKLIVANGHYFIPRLPQLPGIDHWQRLRKLSHSAIYRHPQNLGDKIVVVGDGPSARDISHEMTSAANKVIRAVRGAIPHDEEGISIRGAVVGFREANIVDFEDGSSEGQVDHAILATGYQMDFPFLSKIQTGLPEIHPLPNVLVNSTYSLFPLAQHIFPLQNDFPPTSMAFIGLPLRVVPFPLMQAQAGLVVKIFREPDSFDLGQETAWIRDRYAKLQSKGLNKSEIGKLWLVLKDEEQFKYRDDILRLASILPLKTVPDWTLEIYLAKDRLRRRWVELEAEGKTEKWLKGVGYGGISDWIVLMRRLLELDDSKDAREDLT
jgi:hypothetical protein